MAELMMNQAYFSILRWAADATRDEARNVAVVVVDSEGQFGGVKAAPPSSISPNLKEQGILDTVLFNLTRQFESIEKPDLEWLRATKMSLNHSLYFTDPQPAAAADVDGVLQALYRAYVAPHGAPRAETKGVVLDRVVSTLRSRGLDVKRGEYIEDFIFDAVVSGGHHRSLAIKVLSFATTVKDWAPAERDAGHFLYGLSRLQLPGQAVIQPPNASSAPSAERSYLRITRWFNDESVPVMSPSDLSKAALPI
jgi:hypothetical protein